ncbi:phosphopantetheine-binding protein [Streptomyces sp. G45]|uniref:phosphopantetheine-binding protein n=1 Tax=Streptomyces sp. G45 TaxID=3406627 RepID=UPI003C19DB58
MPHESAKRPDRRLVAYVVPARGDDTPSPWPKGEHLRAFAARTLPEYMVPAVVMVIDELPVTAGGKVDTAQLPEPVAPRPAYVPPTTALEKQLCDLIAVVLRVERVGLRDDFFSLGGDSILVSRLTSRIGKVLGISVPMRAVFEAKDVADLARSMKSASATTKPRLRRIDRSAQ